MSTNGSERELGHGGARGPVVTSGADSSEFASASLGLFRLWRLRLVAGISEQEGSTLTLKLFEIDWLLTS